MFVNGSTLVGRPLTAAPSGKQLDTIKALLLDHVAHRVLGFVVDRGGWAGSARLLQWSDGEVRTADVVQRQDTAIRSAAHEPVIEQLLQTHPLFPTVGVLKLKTPDQHLLGRLNDVVFDRDTGRIQSYEIWRGLPLLGRRISLPTTGLELTYRDGTLVVKQLPNTVSGPTKNDRADIDGTLYCLL